jgi:hypothetical protein
MDDGGCVAAIAEGRETLKSESRAWCSLIVEELYGWGGRRGICFGRADADACGG